MGNSNAAQDRRNLKRLIEAAGFTVAGRASNGYVMRFMGQFRDWLIFAWLHDSWLSLGVTFMELPSVASVRSSLIERALDINGIMSIAKFSKDENILKLDLEYREEHVDVEVFKNLIGMFLAICEKRYPELFKIAAEDAALNELHQAFERPSLSD
jgi:hypothetical protein